MPHPPRKKKTPPRIYMIAGCNGAGKSTLVRELMPTILPLHNLVNPDDIAYGLNPLAPERKRMRAGVIALQQIDSYINAGESFAFETTGAGNTHVRRLGRAQRKGYRIQVIYIFIDSPELAVARVAYRKRQGGHDVPESDIHRRYYRSIRNITKIYMPISDSVAFYRSFGLPGQSEGVRLHCMAIWDRMRGMVIFEPESWQRFCDQQEQGTILNDRIRT